MASRERADDFDHTEENGQDADHDDDRGQRSTGVANAEEAQGPGR